MINRLTMLSGGYCGTGLWFLYWLFNAFVFFRLIQGWLVL